MVESTSPPVWRAKEGFVQSFFSLQQYHKPAYQNVIERALILNPQGPITFGHLSASLSHADSVPESSLDESYNLDEVTTRHISRVLEVAKGKINGPEGAAALLGVNPSTLRNRMKKLGIQYGRAGQK